MSKVNSFLKLLIWIFPIFISGIISVCYGLPIDYDLLNYHLYNPYSFLNGRIGFDMFPCGMHSYFNPILDIPYYLMFKYWLNTPWLISFFQGCYYGILALILFKINVLLFKRTTFKDLFFPLMATAFGMTEVIIFSMLGSTCNDIQIAVLILFAFYFLLKTFFLKNSIKRVCFIFLAAIFAGACFGFKYSFYIFTFILLILFFFKPLRKRKIFGNTLFLFILGGIIGFLLADGYFAYLLYKHFSNPFFPYLNGFFKSEWFPLINKVAPETFFLKFGLKALTINPFYWSVNFLSVSPIKFFDLKHIFAFVSFFGILFMYWKKEIKLNFRWKFLMLFVFLSYLIWCNTISVIRYLSPVLALSGALIVFLFCNVLVFLKNNNIREQKLFCLTLLLYSFCCYQVAPWEKSVEKTVIPDLKLPDNSFVIFTTDKLSYLIPKNNQTAKYVNISMFADELEPLSKKYSDYIKNEIAQKENIYVIGSKDYLEYFANRKESFKKEFNIDYSNCRLIDGITKGKTDEERHSINRMICKVQKKEKT